MSNHAETAAEHAEHAGGFMAEAERVAAQDPSTDVAPGTEGMTVDQLLAYAQVEATLSVAQRLADLSEELGGIADRMPTGA